MKRILQYFTLLVIGATFLAGSVNAQFINATSYFGSTPTSLIITIKPDFDFSAKLDEVGFVIQIPKVVNGTPIAAPTISVLNNFLGTTFSSTWQQISESVSDPNFYNFKLGATALTAAPIITLAAGTELQVLELQISAPVEAFPLIRLAHLASGGPETNYGFAILDGSVGDRTDYAQMFYGTGLVPAAPAATPEIGYTVYQYVLASTSLLPVKFLGFNVTKKEGNGLLAWQIENESSITDRYEIERSLNGLDFKKVNVLLPKKNGSTTNAYEYTEFNLAAIRPSGPIYYRIKQVDKDGQFALSATKSVSLDARNLQIGVYPNPIKTNATLYLDLVKDARITITINDASGKQVQNIPMQLFKGVNKKEINMSGLAAGSYLLKVNTGDEVKTIPLVKTN